MTDLLAMFPGQGSQSVGMGKGILSEFGYIKEVFEEAEDSTRLSIRRLCFEGPEDELQLTAHQQPCILTISSAIWRILHQEAGITCSFFAGHSLGEYSALVASGRLSLAKAAYLVHQRGKAMQEAVPYGKGAMAAVLGYDADKLVNLCKELSAGQGICEVVNFNSPEQQIISGHAEAVKRVIEKLTETSIKAKLLPVSAPFHSSLMKPARDKMSYLLKDLELEKGSAPIIANIDGKLKTTYTSNYLIEQIDHPVLWTDSMTTAYQSGSRRFLEVGPGRVLFGLARRCLPKDVKLQHTNEVADIKAAINWLTA